MCVCEKIIIKTRLCEMNHGEFKEGSHRAFHLDDRFDIPYWYLEEEEEDLPTIEEQLEFEREQACGRVDKDCWDYVLSQETKGVHYLTSIHKWYTSGCYGDGDIDDLDDV